MDILLFWFGGAIIIGIIAHSRGRHGVGWFFLATMISPLLALILVLALPNPHKNSRKCPHCAEPVKKEAAVCKHCGRDLPALQGTMTSAEIGAKFGLSSEQVRQIVGRT